MNQPRLRFIKICLIYEFTRVEVLAADGVLHTGIWVWAIIIGALIVVWIFVGLTNLGKLNTVAMTALFILSLVLFKVIFFGTGSAAPVVDDGSLTFGAAVELAVAMPLSWLPLISDYTREAEKPFAATLVSVVVYSLVSIFMYMIGMGAAIFTGEYDIAQIMLKTGFGVVGLLIIVFSTVTTTFLDAYSAGVSSVSISSKIKEKMGYDCLTYCDRHHYFREFFHGLYGTGILSRQFEKKAFC